MGGLSATSAIAQSPGSELLEPLSADSAGDDAYIALESVEAFALGGGEAVLEPGTSYEETLTYATVDQTSSRLVGLTRAAPLAHSAGVFVQAPPPKAAGPEPSPTPEEASPDPADPEAEQPAESPTDSAAAPPRMCEPIFDERSCGEVVDDALGSVVGDPCEPAHIACEALDDLETGDPVGDSLDDLETGDSVCARSALECLGETVPATGLWIEPPRIIPFVESNEYGILHPCSVEPVIDEIAYYHGWFATNVDVHGDSHISSDCRTLVEDLHAEVRITTTSRSQFLSPLASSSSSKPCDSETPGACNINLFHQYPVFDALPSTIAWRFYFSWEVPSHDNFLFEMEQCYRAVYFGPITPQPCFPGDPTR